MHKLDKKNQFKIRKKFAIITLVIVAIVTILLFLYELTGEVDDCYKRVSAGKGIYYEIKDNHVCIEHERGVRMVTIRTLAGADPKTFKEIDGLYYFSDKNHVYYGSEVIEGAHPASFQFVGKSYFKDDASIFYHGKKVAGDYGTFEPIENLYDYAKDKNAVFYGGEKIDELDSKTFKIFPESYYNKDKYHVYLNREMLVEADAKTFQVLNDRGRSYAKDMNHAYYYGKLIPEADTETFKIFKNIYAMDKNYVYHNETLLKNLDVNAFEQVGQSDYLRDNNSLYYFGEEVVGVNVGSFHPISYNKQTAEKISYFGDETSCGTDGVVVICNGELITGGEIVE